MKKLLSHRLIRTIPWYYLSPLLFLQIYTDYLLIASHAPFLAVVMTVTAVISVALPGSIVEAGVDAGGIVMFLIVFVGCAMTAFQSGFAARVVVITILFATCGVIAWSRTVHELEKSFSKFHTFLILTVTSSLSLGLGLILSRLFNPAS